MDSSDEPLSSDIETPVNPGDKPGRPTDVTKPPSDPRRPVRPTDGRRPEEDSDPENGPTPGDDPTVTYPNDSPENNNSDTDQP